VAANLAVALARTGASVGLMDADIYGPSMPMMFGLQGQRPEMEGEKIIPIKKHGVHVLSIGLLIDEKQAVVWRGPMASNALRQFFTDVAWGELDYLLIDLPPGTGDIHLTLAQLLEVAGAVVVTTPQQVALADARKGAAMFNMTSINIPLLGVIENMSWFTPIPHPDERYFILGKGGGRALADELGVPLLGQIPLVQGIAEAADQGQPVVLHEGNPSAVYYADLAGEVARVVAVRNAG
jgi:ATP-binding protein involved in chromosome partitioning